MQTFVLYYVQTYYNLLPSSEDLEQITEEENEKQRAASQEQQEESGLQDRINLSPEERKHKERVEAVRKEYERWSAER